MSYLLTTIKRIYVSWQATICRPSLVIIIQFFIFDTSLAGFYSHAWDFDNAANYQFDPDNISVNNSMTSLKAHELDLGNTVSLNGVDQYAKIDDSQQQDLNMGTDDFVFATWLRIDPGSTFKGIYQKRGNNQGVTTGIEFHLERTGSVHRLRTILRTQNGDASEYIAANAINDNAWHQVVLAVNRTDGLLKYFLDGESFGPTFNISNLSGSLDNPATFFLGINSLGKFSGNIDEAVLWKFQGGLPANLKELVRSHFDLQVIHPANIVSFWKFDDGTGEDSVGQNHLTLVNNPSIVAASIQKYSYDAPYIESQCEQLGNQALYSFLETTGATSTGLIRYQLSSDDLTWYYYDNQAGWIIANSAVKEQASLAYQLRENLSSFPLQSDNICIRALLVSNGLQPVSLDRIEVIQPPLQTYFINEPAAARPLPDSFRIIFETNLPTECAIEYRLAGENGTNPWTSTPLTTGGSVFNITVGGLTPDTEYEYRVKYRPVNTTDSFHFSQSYQLNTPPTAGTPVYTEFAVWADSRPPGGNPVQPSIYNQLMSDVSSYATDFLVNIGDMVDLSGAAPFSENQAFDFYKGWRDAYDIAGGNAYMFFGLGNHDGEGLWEPLRSYATTGRLRATSQPNNGDSAQRYYVWRWGDALFIMLDGSKSVLVVHAVN